MAGVKPPAFDWLPDTYHHPPTQKIRFLNTRMPVATAIAALTRGLPKYSCWHARLKKFLDLGPNEYAFFLRFINFLFLFFWGHEYLFHCFLSCTFCFLAFVFLVVFWGQGGLLIFCLLACLCVCFLFCFVFLLLF